MRQGGWTVSAGFPLLAPAAWAATNTAVNTTSESSFSIDTFRCYLLQKKL
jgi:hypothetical protein